MPISFNNRLHSPFEIDISNERIPYILREFIPAKNVSVPYLTIAKDRQFNQSNPILVIIYIFGIRQYILLEI